MQPSWLVGLDAHDRALFEKLALGPAARPSTARLWRAITHVGGAKVSIGFSILPAALPRVTWAQVMFCLLLLGVSHLLVQIAKRTIGRSRPALGTTVQALIAEPDRFSFPSGHSCAAMAIALGWSMAFPVLGIPLLALAMIVGWSRVRLAVHYPGDVVVGQLIAFATAGMLAVLL